MPAALKTFVAVVIRWALSLRIVRALLLYTEKRGPVLADSVTYRALFSVFAAVLLGFSAAALWLAGNPEAWNALVSAVNSVIPGLIGGENAVIREEDLRSGLDQFQSGLHEFLCEWSTECGRGTVHSHWSSTSPRHSRHDRLDC